MGELELALPYCLACDYLLSECRCNNKPPTSFLRDLLKDGADLAVLIPEDSAPELVVERLRECTACYRHAFKVGTIAAMAIGRCLDLASKDPAIWRAAGYQDYATFEREEMIGVAHGTWFNAKKVQKVFRGMQIEQRVVNGGITNVVTASHLLPPDASERQKLDALQHIALPTAEFNDRMERLYHHSNGTASYGYIRVEGNRAQRDFINGWLDDARAQEALETRHPMEMLFRLVEAHMMELDEQMPIEHTTFDVENGEGVPF